MVAQRDLTVWDPKNISHHCQIIRRVVNFSFNFKVHFSNHIPPSELFKKQNKIFDDKRAPGFNVLISSLEASQIKCMQAVYNQNIGDIAASNFNLPSPAFSGALTQNSTVFNSNPIGFGIGVKLIAVESEIVTNNLEES